MDAGDTLNLYMSGMVSNSGATLEAVLADRITIGGTIEATDQFVIAIDYRGGGALSIPYELTGSEADIAEIEGTLISLINTNELLKNKVIATSGPANGVILISPKTKLTFDAQSDVDATEITIAGHGFQNNDAVTYSKSAGTAIGELTDGETYYIVGVSENKFSLAATKGGSAIALTDGASESHAITFVSAPNFVTTASATHGSEGEFSDSLATVARTTVVSYDPNSVADFDKMSAADKVVDGFTYKALDNSTLNDHGNIAETTVVVTVSGANDRPDAVSEAKPFAAVEEGAVVSVDVLANDTDADAIDTPESLIINSAVSEYGAKVSISGGDNPAVIYNPSDVDGFQSLAEGETLTDTVTYTIRDAAGAVSREATFKVTVTGTNDAPVAAADSFKAYKGDVLNIASNEGVLLNDTDVDLGSGEVLKTIAEEVKSSRGQPLP